MKILRPIFAAGAFLLVGINAHATDRSVEEMRAVAQQFLNRKNPSRALANGGVTPTVALLATSPETATFGYPEGGFAVVSQDDALPAILTYGDGQYDRVMENPSFANYMRTYDAYLADCAAKGIAPRFINKAATFNPEGVKEIMKCRWDQGSPYNLMCPFIYKENKEGQMVDARTITGCVATAMAQILYTLAKQGNDIKLRGAKYYYYIDENKRLAFEQANLASIPLDWDNMLDTYTSTTGHVQNMAVARLMYACGVAAEMVYATGASGTYCSTAHDGLNEFFEGIKDEYTGYGIEEFYQRIYDELDAGRPVMLSGANAENGGHCFVGDGYDDQGRIHLNLGWSGGGNTFTNFVDMGGFTQAQTANFISPEANDGLKLSADTPIPELQGMYITADLAHPAESIEEGRWYVLYNKGRFSSVHSTGSGKTIQNTHYVPVADPADVAAPLIVRFINKGTNKYAIQMGTGDYLGALDYGTNKGSETTGSFAYTTGKIQNSKTKKYFWFKQNGMTLDCNGVGGKGIAGWGTDTPTDTLGHNCWMLLPVTLRDNPEIPTLGPNNFDPDHRYILVNYDGTKNYYFNLKATCTIASKSPTELRLTAANGGWHISNFADENAVVSAKVKDFKLGNGATKGEFPLAFSFEPTGETVDTGDADLDACAAFYRIRCENGYLAPQKIALGSSIYINNGYHADLGRWLLIDQTLFQGDNPEGVVPAVLDANEPAAPIYDLSGRRINAPQRGALYIQGGRKVLQ